MKIMFWNLNKRFYLFESNLCKFPNPIISNQPDMFFISETGLAYGALPNFKGYKCIADPNHNVVKSGGIAWFVKNTIYPHVVKVKYNKCYISFMLDIIPSIVFIGIYIYPQNSRYFLSSMFSELTATMIDFHDKNYNIIAGGDINCRPGDLNNIINNSKWTYSENVDTCSNTHGNTFFKDMCRTADIMPLNHLIYKSKRFDGTFTYYKDKGKSQIDFGLVDLKSRTYISDFVVIKKDWHISDHLPLLMKCNFPSNVDLSNILSRARDLNETDIYKSKKYARFNKHFDYGKIENTLVNKMHEINNVVFNEIDGVDIEAAFNSLDYFLKESHQGAKVQSLDNSSQTIHMDNLNTYFKTY